MDGYEGFRAVVTTDGEQDLGEVRLTPTP